MRTRHTLLAGFGLTLAAMAWTPSASGYAIEVHKDFYDLAYGGQPVGAAVTPPSEADLASFRSFFYRRAAGNSKFLQRWPTEASFTPAAFKSFLLLNPGKRVVAIDYVPTNRPRDRRTIVREGSVDPDNDNRNQDRLYLQGGSVVLDAFGRAVPDDPRTTWFGGLTGTPSQFDAHGATLRTGKKGGGIMTALRNPSQFARPAVSLGSAPEFSESYTNLALISKLWGGNGSEWLSLTFGGNNMHGIEDLGNQIHTTVLGTWKFFLDAKKVFYKIKFKRFLKNPNDPSSAGYVAPTNLTTAQINDAMAKIKAGNEDQVDKKILFALGKEPKGAPTDTDLGLLIIGNHHRLLEDFVQKLYLDSRAKIQAGDTAGARPEVVQLIQTARAGDAAFEAKCRAALQAAGLGSKDAGMTPFARVLAENMILVSAPEAQPIYEAIRAISKKVTKNGGTYDEKLGHQPLDFVETSDPKNKDVKKIWDFSGKAFARVVTALRLWDEVFRRESAGVAPGSPAAIARAHKVIDRMVGEQLERIEAGEARRADYLAERQKEWDELQQPKRGIFQKIKGWFR